MLNVDHTVRSYSGKSGCMCGCLGKYNEGTRARKMAATQLVKDPAVRLETWQRAHNEPEAGCLFVRTDTRTRVLYLTEQGVSVARDMGIAEMD